MFKENKYDGRVYYVLAGKHDLCVSVHVNSSKTEGIMVIAPREYISVFGPSILTILNFSLSKV